MAGPIVHALGNPVVWLCALSASAVAADRHPVSVTMTATDSYRTRFQATVAALRYWAPQLRSAAHIEEEESASHWRLAAHPHVPSACPFELVLQPEPRFDIIIADESYEDVEFTSFDLFLPLLSAIAAGKVVQRTSFSRNTGVWRSVETVVTLANGTQWRRDRLNEPLARVLDEADCFNVERHFAPYLREAALVQATA